jgi:hypothetical protein
MISYFSGEGFGSLLIQYGLYVGTWLFTGIGLLIIMLGFLTNRKNIE